MHRFRLLSVLLITALGVGACKKDPSQAAVATVDGQAITQGAYDAALKQTLERYQGAGAALPPGLEERLKEIVLRRLVDEAIVAKAAKDNKMEISDADLDARFAEHRDRFASPEAFDRFLERSHTTAASMREEMRQSMLRDKVVEKLAGPVEVSDEEIQKQYDENPGRFRQRERRELSRVVVHVAKDADATTRKAAKAKIEAILKKAKAGGDFDALAASESEGPAAKNGGKIGWFHRGQFPADYDTAVFATAVGSITPVLETPLGYEIVKVLQAEDERQKTLEEVKETIQRSLLAREKAEKRRDVLRDLKDKSKIEYMIKFEQPDAAFTKKDGALEPKTETAEAGAGAPVQEQPAAVAPVAAPAPAVPPAAVPTPAH